MQLDNAVTVRCCFETANKSLRSLTREESQKWNNFVVKKNVSVLRFSFTIYKEYEAFLYLVLFDILGGDYYFYKLLGMRLIA